jgi:hypothetical protein
LNVFFAQYIHILHVLAVLYMIHVAHGSSSLFTRNFSNGESPFWILETWASGTEMPFWNASIVITIVVGFAAHMILKLKHWRDSTITSHAHDPPHSHVQRWWVDWTIHLSVGGRLRPCILKLARLEVATPPTGHQHSLDQGYLLVFSYVYCVFCRRQEGVESEGRGDCDILSAGACESEGRWWAQRGPLAGFEKLNKGECKGERAAAASAAAAARKIGAGGGQGEDGAIAVYLSARSSTSKSSAVNA